VPLPFDESHVTYVWVDALINYLTASGAIHPQAPEGSQGFDDTTDSWWPPELHIVGKDILTPHAVYWPTLLMAAGLPLPKKLLAHGWWLSGKAKMSKSLGNVVDPLDLREGFGTDAVRWYLMREMPTGSDASYTEERFLARYGELANVLGNLASRATSMVVQYSGGVVPEAVGVGLDGAIRGTLEEFHSAMRVLRIHDALECAMEFARTVNGYVESSEPWKLARDPERQAELEEVLATLMRSLIILCALFVPVMPRKMGELSAALGLPSVPSLEQAMQARPDGLTVEKMEPLFPRADQVPAYRPTTTGGRRVLTLRRPTG
jgi:methionyl-tRNA synthetase